MPLSCQLQCDEPAAREEHTTWLYAMVLALAFSLTPFHALGLTFEQSTPGGSSIEFNIIADDGFVFLGVLDTFVPDSISLEAEMVGVLQPRPQLRSIDVFLQDELRSGFFGTSGFAYSLIVDSLRFQYVISAFPGERLRASVINFDILGSLEVPGGTIPISLSGAICCEALSDTRLSGNESYLGFYTGPGDLPYASRLVANAELGSVGGVTYSMGTVRSVLTDESFVAVPEPSLVGLIASSLVALAVMRGRKCHS